MPSRTAQPSGKRTALSVLIGLVIPFFGIAVAPFLFHGVTIKIFGFPFLYFWIFSWFVLTTVCLAVCWYVIDGPVHQELEFEDGEEW